MIENDTSERYSNICLYCECELNHSKENKANKNHLRKYCSENHKALYKKEVISKIAYTERKLKAEKEKSLFKPTLLQDLPILSDELMNEFISIQSLHFSSSYKMAIKERLRTFKIETEDVYLKKTRVDRTTFTTYRTVGVSMNGMLQLVNEINKLYIEDLTLNHFNSLKRHRDAYMAMYNIQKVKTNGIEIIKK